MNLDNQFRQSVARAYNVPPEIELRADMRGMMNETIFVGEDRVLTIFNNRSLPQVRLIAEIVANDTSGLLPPVIPSNNGAVARIARRPAVLWQRLDGNHHVGRDHSDKKPIPEAGQASVAQAFWRLHSYLGHYNDQADKLNKVNYLPNPSSGEPEVVLADLPDFLQTDGTKAYLQAQSLPLKYPALVHHDFERQNALHDDQGRVTGIVDADSFKQGDLLFEYCRCMMNFMFSDPDYQPVYADHFMTALMEAGMVDKADMVLMPVLIQDFIAKDLLDYCRYDHPPKTDLQALSGIYETSWQRVEAYFSGFLPHLFLQMDKNASNSPFADRRRPQ